jgi:hypothetical protein
MYILFKTNNISSSGEKKVLVCVFWSDEVVTNWQQLYKYIKDALFFIVREPQRNSL